MCLLEANQDSKDRGRGKSKTSLMQQFSYYFIQTLIASGDCVTLIIFYCYKPIVFSVVVLRSGGQKWVNVIMMMTVNFLQEESSREGGWLWCELSATHWRWGADSRQEQSAWTTGAGLRAVGSHHTHSNQHTTSTSAPPTSTRDSKVSKLQLLYCWWDLMHAHHDTEHSIYFINNSQ